MSIPIPLATVDDVQARTEQVLTPAERARVTILCADASAMARSLVPSMTVPAPATAVGVVSAAVLRALATPPEGLKDEAIGGHSRTLAHDGGGLYFTDTELDLLRPAPNGGAFSIWT
ncbi:hypothetical protein UK23_10500 [Lentzea aerocolonigenes]|uniref:Uncharacterized protein n=1 Tax=Lentzea aerocolonigenes TaxID=68170 RepID=A0A0F0H9Y3_LENAE|nr:hypothetical protein [Lentzea aerocolonigenes]KJK50423.1 hypothetical protein UK23_10500 [Lentzea aerocolonigenes]